MDGILNILKEQDFTSNDVVAKLRGICHMKKIGHTGTLDPNATGVLPVCLGSATKLCDVLKDHDKVYETVLLLGKSSDTQDIWGSIEKEVPVTASADEAEEAVKSFIGDYDQLPPMYSAKKINGQKLYDLARQGITVERKTSKVVIYDIDILSIDLPRIRMRVHCGKGTYIRTLCNDIGEKLGCGGLMEELVRLKVGDFNIDEALTLKRVEELVRTGQIEEYLIPVDSVFSDYDRVILPKEYDKAVHNGNPLDPAFTVDINKSYVNEKEARNFLNAEKVDITNSYVNQTPEFRQSAEEVNIIKSYVNKRYRIYDSENRFMGIYEYNDGKKMLMPWKMFLH